MIAHPYPEFKKKLSLLKAKQHQRQIHYFCRSLIVSAFASGILAVVMSSSWQIKGKSQVIVVGDRYFAVPAIFDVLKLTYPQSIISFPTHTTEARLQAISALESVEVTKTLFPPLIKIYLQERTPIAVALSSGQVGFLDDQGVWLEPNLYNYTETDFPLSQIKVVNFKAQYSKIWSEIYSLIVAYPTIEVKEVLWDDSGNLFLMTDNLKIILGSNPALLSKQFNTLASFPNFTNNQQLKNIAHIDLTNPDTPYLERQPDFKK